MSYIPDPLRSVLQGLRQILPSDTRPQPHITILPPRPLNARLEAVSKEAQKILQRFNAFNVELSHARFFPETNLIYLEIAEGDSDLRDLHNALNTGFLKYNEEFEFQPHLTLGRAIPDAGPAVVKSRITEAWRSASCRRFTLDEVVLVWLTSSGAGGEWRREWSYSLSEKAVEECSTVGVTSRTF